MPKTLMSIIIVLALCTASLAQDVPYYKAIQKAPSKIQPAQFKKIEEDALKDFSRPESYELLATSFGNTTEKVWVVIYGEVYCNLSSDADRISQIGSLVYRWYEGSLSRQGNGFVCQSHRERSVIAEADSFRVALRAGVPDRCGGCEG